jgi:hypothetical protein
LILGQLIQYSLIPLIIPLRDPGSGKKIPCWGQRRLQLSFNGQQFSWDFLLAEVEFPILGVDFLRHYKLAVDAAAGQLLHTGTLQRLDASAGEVAGELSSILATTPSAYRVFFSEFPEVTDPSGSFPPAKHKVEHHIVTFGRPVTARFRRLDPEKLVAAKAEFEQMEAAGIIRQSDSCWSSPLNMVRKPDGTLRPCGDYRRLNLVTRPDKYPVPNMTNLAARLHG